MIDVALLVFGLGRSELTTNAGIVAAVVMGLAVVAMILVAMLPAFSERWADHLGTSDAAEGGPDPSEVIPGREEPIAAPSTSRSAAPDGSADDEENTAIPERETAGEEGSTDEDEAGRAEEARQNAADERGGDDPAA